MTKKHTLEADLEKIPLLVIFKQDGKINADIANEKISVFELYGFLKVYLELMKKNLMDTFDFGESEL